MVCLIAVEDGAAQAIRQELVNSKLYDGWQFEICTSTEELERWSSARIDVLVISRFLPGENPNKLLEKLKLLFPMTHIVLLVGDKSDRQQLYIKNAKANGLYNIVEGKLPGDRPYTIFEALTSPREPDMDGYYKVGDLHNEAGNKAEPDNSEEILPPQNWLNNNIATMEQGDGDNDDRVIDQENEKTDNIEILKSEIERLREIVDILGKDTNININSERTLIHDPRSKGITVCSAANKGGVGKTTVAIALATALSNAGVSTVLVDYDLGSPNIASLFGINGIPGIESLAGRPVRESNLQDLIVKKGNLNILPGVMNKTMPNFKKGQLLEIVNALNKVYSVVVVDTPPEYWTKPWLADIFSRADYVLAVTDQSILAERDSENYAPALLAMGVTPDKIGIVLNKFSPKLHNPRKVEKVFCAGFKKEVKNLPRIVALIPENWNEYVQKGYKGEIAGLEDIHSQWHRLAENIARMAGYGYKQKPQKLSLKLSLKDRLFSKFRKAAN